MTKHITTGLLILALSASLMQSTDGSAASLKINKKKVTLTRGTTCKLKIKGLNGKKSVAWKSSNKRIASVNKKGVVTAKKKGNTTITAKVQKKKFRCRVTVKKSSTSTKVPAAAKTATATKAPTNSVTPSINKYPSANTCPSVTQCPTVTKIPVFPFPMFTSKPSATKAPSATAKPSAPSSSSSSTVTEAGAYQVLNSLRSTYPEGMTLTNSYYYYSPCFGNGYGCYGFAAKLSDTVFGTDKSCSTHTSFDKIKVGDNIRISNSHSVIVLTKNDNAITVVEGNYNSSVHWDRTITKSSLAKDGFKVTTRY